MRCLTEYKIKCPVDLFPDLKQVFGVMVNDLIECDLLKGGKAYSWGDVLDMCDEV